MPRSSRGDSHDDDDEGSDNSRKNPRRGTAAVSYSENNDAMDVDDAEDNNDDDNNDDAEMEEAEEHPEDDNDEEEEEDTSGGRRRSSRARSNSTSVAATASKENIGRRSARATKFQASMKEPTDKDLLLRDTNSNTNKSNGKDKGKASTAKRSKSSSSNMDTDEDESEDENATKPTSKKQASKRGAGKNTKQTPAAQKKQAKKKKEPSSPHKAPARRHRTPRLSINHTHTTTQESDSDSDASQNDDSTVEESDSENEEDEEPFKIQRIIASRTEPRNAWAKIGAKMNTNEIDYGSRWVQDPVDENDDTYEERYLVKWHDMSYLHVSWETESDLLELVENAKNYLSTFFRKSSHGLLFSSDERCDGDYFDPGWTQVDRLLEVHFPDECPIKSVKNEDKITNDELGICLDKENKEAFEEGLGRQFLIKWGNSQYAESTYEYERDLILNEVEYKDQLKDFHRRKKKPTKDQAKKLQKAGDLEFRRLYKEVFGDKSDSKDEDGVEKYQQDLQNFVFKNGGQLRDYQAEGVSWMLSNYINKRSGILADEMGLGKTIQTASFINLIATKLNRRGPFLIIAPLSTLAHWQREFEGWTMLNTIVYHGSAKDREFIRELEIAHESRRPSGGLGFNQLYLRKCRPKKNETVYGNPWMAEVVITTPELLCADDYQELACIDWECLVVDEAHRLKNHSSKLAVNLRDNKFVFGHKVLLTGTPIQNTMQELHALLTFVAPDLFDDVDDFMEKYGDMKSKERIDELHEEIRPFILRRLKEDVEKSVPPKEETVIEVELTVAQKQYYRALYEKNVKFLHKNKKKALDGPSLNNLAMQLRKCCNHLFLLNGIEEEYREKQVAEGKEMSEGDLLVSASGKLVLLDKLLPRLKENGHRVLIFSQFKIMLDVLEDYLHNREVNFERIDGSITGNKRQQAIDRFQTPDKEGSDRESPFIMLLSTRAGGVGINLTAADTCIIFDSDWNPQNDLQAQARCHRIGQTKSVKVYRLLTAKTYEMQMFHMSSLKMGLDQAVLSGFEAGTSGEGALSKEEVEKLLRHGAYGIFSEDQENPDAEANAFVQQDIDTILERRSRTVVHDNTGSQSSAAGGTFSKARFSSAPAAGEKKSTAEDVDVEDPDFWKKMVGEAKEEDDKDDIEGQRRKRKVMNYSEGIYEKQTNSLLEDSDAEDDEDESGDEDYDSDDENENRERSRWGGSKPQEWKKDEAKKLLNLLHAHGYASVPWATIVKELAAKNGQDETEVQRMSWAILLLVLCEIAQEDAAQSKKRAVRAAEKKRESSDSPNPSDGGVLEAASEEVSQEMIQRCFNKLWATNACWASSVFDDALAFARKSEPRDEDILYRALDSTAIPGSGTPLKQDEISSLFVQNVWPSLKTRGWKAAVLSDGPHAGKTQYSYEGKQYYSIESVLSVAGSIHSELAHVIDTMRSVAETSRQKSAEQEAQLKEKHLAMKAGSIDVADLEEFLRKYAPLQLLADRKSHKRLHLSSRKMMHACTFLHTAASLVKLAESSRGGKPLIDRLTAVISVDKRMTLPHPLWSTKHDAILIHAIAKHGWIDNEASCKRITKDDTIKWGFPFDSDRPTNEEEDANSSSKKTSQRERMINNLRETSTRAAALFNDHNDTLDEVKGFNKNLVIRAFSLRYENHDESDDEGDGNDAEETPKSPRSRWVVDEAQLLASTGLETPEEQDFVELPTKKDLVKRAKLILLKNVDLVGSQSQLAAQVETTKVDVNIPKNYFVLDQSDRCNVLLAEILRATVKAPYPKSQNAIRLLCAIATEEAIKRQEALSVSPDSEEANKGKPKAVVEMAETVKNIDTAKRCLKDSRQAKNILRVILGLEIVKHPRGSPFPGERSISDNQKGGNGSRNPLNAAAKSKKEDSAVGDRALARAMAKCFDRNGGGPGRVSPEGHSPDLELTAIETLIVSVICSQGLPNTANLVSDDQEKAASDGSLSLGWSGLCGVLEGAAKEWHETAERKVNICQDEYAKYEEQELESQPKVRARKNLANAIKIAEVKELASSQAADYAEDPSVLAKKTIMLIERLRRKMGHNIGGHTKTTKKSNFWLGPKVFDFLSTQLSEWANSLDIIDSNFGTLSYTAADFYHDLPAEERERVEVVTVLNKQDCRQLLIQITLLSRLRSFFTKYPKHELISRIEKAAKNCKVGDVWEAQPSWWTSGGDSPAHYDALMLESLVEFGFGCILATDVGGGGLRQHMTPEQLADLTKASIQQRANQLCRELHNLERAHLIMNEIDKRKTKQDASGANGGGPKKAKQTGLHSFFSKTAHLRNNKVTNNVAVVLSDDEDVPKDPDGIKFGEEEVYEEPASSSSPSNKRLLVESTSADGVSEESPEKKKKIE